MVKIVLFSEMLEASLSFKQISSAMYIMNHLPLLENCQPQNGKLAFTTGSSTEIKIICL